MEKINQVVTEETETSPKEKIISNHKSNSGEMAASEPSVNEGQKSKDLKRKAPVIEEADGKRGEHSQAASVKKPKFTWTNELHNCFLEAIRNTSLDRVVPKKILEIMNVPGLTRQNVASHLQKYRKYLRRISDPNYEGPNSSKKGGRSSRSTFTSSTTSPSLLILNASSIPQSQNPEPFPGSNAASFPNQGTSSSTFIAQPGFELSRYLSNRENFLRTKTGTTNLINQGNHAFVSLAPNNFMRNAPFQFQGHLSRNLSTSFDTSVSVNPTNRMTLGTGSEVSPPMNNGITSTHISSVPSDKSIPFQLNSNCTGYRISNIHQVLGPGHVMNKYGSLESCTGIVNMPIDLEQFQNKSTVAKAAAPMSANDCTKINIDPLAPQVGASSASASQFMSDLNAGGDQFLLDVVDNYCETLDLSDLECLLQTAEDNEGNQVQESDIVDLMSDDQIPDSDIADLMFGDQIPESDIADLMFDLDEFDAILTQHQALEGSDLNSTLAEQVIVQSQALEGSDLNSTFAGQANVQSHALEKSDLNATFADQVNVQNQALEESELNAIFADQVNILSQAQQMGGENGSGPSFNGGASDWDNHVPPFDQVPNELEDYGFLESLLAGSPSGEEHTDGFYAQ